MLSPFRLSVCRLSGADDPAKGLKNGDILHGGITRQNWYHFVQNYLIFMKLDV